MAGRETGSHANDFWSFFIPYNHHTEGPEVTLFKGHHLGRRIGGDEVSQCLPKHGSRADIPSIKDIPSIPKTHLLNISSCPIHPMSQRNSECVQLPSITAGNQQIFVEVEESRDHILFSHMEIIVEKLRRQMVKTGFQGDLCRCVYVGRKQEQGRGLLHFITEKKKKNVYGASVITWKNIYNVSGKAGNKLYTQCIHKYIKTKTKTNKKLCKGKAQKETCQVIYSSLGGGKQDRFIFVTTFFISVFSQFSMANMHSFCNAKINEILSVQLAVLSSC